MKKLMLALSVLAFAAVTPVFAEGGSCGGCKDGDKKAKTEKKESAEKSADAPKKAEDEKKS